MTTKRLENYLDNVRQALGNHPEAEEIISELHAHIWDYANNLSRQSGCSVEDAFSLAIDSMEDPKTMAQSFQHVPAVSLSQWREPQSVLPEKKLSDRDFMFVGMIGFFVATIILSIISWVGDTTGTDVGLANFVVRLIQFLILLLLILGFLYYRNEQEFSEQMDKLRKKFEKIKQFDDSTDDNKIKMKAAELHIEGFFEVLFGAAGLVFFLYASFIVKSVVFTSNWYTVGLAVVVVLSILEILRGIFQLFVGQIRISRLINGTVEIFNVIGSTLMIIFYPLDLDRWFSTFENPTAVTIVNWIYSVTSDPDNNLRVFFGISVVLYTMNAVYNFIKFGVWKPSHQRSLTIKVNNE